jgi:RHS repeat-associated protein
VTNRWNTVGLRTNLAILQPASYFNVDYEYDSAKRLSSVDSTAGTFGYTYNPGLNSLVTASKLVDRLALPNTSYITNSWDGLGRLTDTYLKSNGGTALNRHSYTYNNGNQRTRQTRQDDSYLDYLYDDVGELYSANAFTSGGTTIGSENRGYAFDPAWNIIKKTNNTAVSSFVLNALNEVLTNGSTTLSYDGNGNRTSLTGSGTTIYDYDDENQLVTVYKDPATYSGAWRSEFTYDGLQRLRRRVDYLWLAPGNWAMSAETRYVYDSMLVVQERDAANLPTVTYTRGVELSHTLQGAGGIGGLLARSHGYNSTTGAWATNTFYHADGNGNITYLEDSTQALAASYKYDPFGNLISSSGTLASANVYRFSSKSIHSSSGMYYYGYRWYDPLFQRWLNRDPIQEFGGINLYSFVRNNPFRYDPFGLFAPGVSIGIGVGIGVPGAGAIGVGVGIGIIAITHPSDPNRGFVPPYPGGSRRNAPPTFCSVPKTPPVVSGPGTPEPTRPSRGENKYEIDLEDCMEEVMEAWNEAHPGQNMPADQFWDAVENCMLDKGNNPF